MISNCNSLYHFIFHFHFLRAEVNGLRPRSSTCDSVKSGRWIPTFRKNIQPHPFEDGNNSLH
jgi:hypothetical protein